MFTNSLFTMCIPILFWCFSYPCIFRIMQAKWALTELLQLQVGVEGNFVWFVLLLPRRRPPHLSCSIDRSIHQTRHHDSWPSFAASDLLPCRRHTHRNGITIIDSADEPEEYTGPQERSHSFVSAYVMHCLNLPATLSSCSALGLPSQVQINVQTWVLN